MRKLTTIFVLGLAAILMTGIANEARADLDVSQISIQRPPKEDNISSPYDQLLSLQIGGFSPQSLQISNGGYSFNYSGASSLLTEAGWAVKLLDAVGSFYFEGNVGFSKFDGNVSQAPAQPAGEALSSSYSLYLLGLDLRLMYSADWLPVKWLIPFGDAGYQEAFYFQPASSGLQSVEGNTGNFVAGGGLRVWLNRRASLERGGMPVFLSAKYNRVFSSGGAMDLASSSVMGGLSLGL